MIGFWQSVREDLASVFESDPAAYERRRVHIPMGRLGVFDDIAGAVLYLASDDSAWTTGQALVVDGGITAAYTTPA